MLLVSNLNNAVGSTIHKPTGSGTLTSVCLHDRMWHISRMARAIWILHFGGPFKYGYYTQSYNTERCVPVQYGYYALVARSNMDTTHRVTTLNVVLPLSCVPSVVCMCERVCGAVVVRFFFFFFFFFF